jgi:SAM-dependent methyltransferase
MNTAPQTPFAAPIDVTDIAECYFYHTMDVPGHGVLTGEWDLRGGVDDYLGHEDVAGKRVLEIGTASGFLCFEMERRGADVVAYDLSAAQSWDIVPYAGLDLAQELAQRRDHITRLNKSWWFNHRALGSRANVVYGTVYAIPASIGPIDLCTFGAILLHVRDPFLALQNAAALRPSTIVVTELAQRRPALSRRAGEARYSCPTPPKANRATRGGRSRPRASPSCSKSSVTRLSASCGTRNRTRTAARRCSRSSRGEPEPARIRRQRTVIPSGPLNPPSVAGPVSVFDGATFPVAADGKSNTAFAV